MKVCPFCRESVHDDAVKCRYCGSSLLRAKDPSEGGSEGVPAAAPGKVVYVVDSGLISFGKFVVAVLALFLAIGVFFYGFDLKQTGEEVAKTVAQVQELEEKTKTIEQDVEKAKTAVDADRGKLQAMLADAEAKLNAISDKDKQATVLLTRFASKAGVPAATEAGSAAPPPAPSTAFTVPEVARLYNFPLDLHGKGQTIGLIELGGGYNPKDFEAYFSHLKLPVPQITSVSVDGAKNAPTGDPNSADGQVTLDIEVAGAVAYAAHIVVYFAPNTNSGFLDAVKQAIADKQNPLSVLSMSWGSPESTWTTQATTAMNNAFAEARDHGITVLAPAGDNGATDGVGDGQLHVDFPSSSPWVLACGGTRLTASNGNIRSEVVWNDSNGIGVTGGGVSALFPRPVWQSGINVPLRLTGASGRGTPDVVANASPESGYILRVAGTSVVLGGTSVSTPLWAGLIAILNEGLGHRVGYLNPLLYTKIGPGGVLRAITQGNNTVGAVKGYSAGPGWTPVAGWGSPDGVALLDALRKMGQ